MPVSQPSGLPKIWWNVQVDDEDDDNDDNGGELIFMK